MLTSAASSRLESIIEQDEYLSSAYYLIKSKAAEIIKWNPPTDQSVPGIPPYYSDHGVEHSLRILRILDRLTENITLKPFEIFPLLCSVWLHDVGMFVGRAAGESYEATRSVHHLRSIEFIKAETEAGRLPLNQWQLPNVLDICRAHRSKVAIDDIPKSRPFEDGSADIRIRLLATFLRIADACDVHYSRAPETVFEIHEEFIPRVSKEHWRKHFRMAHVRFNWDKSSIDIPINLPEDDLEQTEQRRLASLIKTELTAELRSVAKIFEEYGINLFHADIIDYVKGEYIDFSHVAENDPLGWAITPFAKRTISHSLDVLLFQPILSQEEVNHCYVEIPVIKELMQDIEKADFKENYLFCSHPRTGKTSMLACLSAKASVKGCSVFWFSRQMSVPKISDFVHRLSIMAAVDEGTILVFDNIHEDKQILSLMSDLRKQYPKIVIWCASRISEFTNMRAQWDEMAALFVEKEMPGYLDSTSIRLFLDKYRELIDEETENLILNKQNITAYYLVDVYRRLKSNSLSETRLLPKEVVGQISLDVKEDNQKTFGSLDDMERIALKIISFLKTTPRILLENLLLKIDSKKSNGVVNSLLKRRIVFPSMALLPTYRQVEVEVINIFDSFKEFVIEQLLELETKKVIPALLLSEARAFNNEIPHALLALMKMFSTLDEEHKEHTRLIIFANRKNPFVLNIASNLASKNEEYLELAEDAYDIAPDIEADILADFGYALYKANDYSKAIRFFVKALEYIPTNASWLHFLAHSYEKVNDLNAALTHMEKAESLDNNRYLDCLGVIYSNLGREDDAFKCYEKTLACDPLNAKAWHNIGNIYGNRKDSDKQMECYKKALEIDPEFIWSLQGLAHYYWRFKDYPKTVEYSVKVIAQNDKNAVSWSLLGRAHFKMGQFVDAKDALEKTIELNEATCNDFEYLGDIYEALKDIKKQIFYYNKAIEYHPEHATAFLKLGLAYFINEREYKTAYDYYLKAAKYITDDASLHIFMGKTLYELANLAKAQREYEIALELDSDAESANYKMASECLEEIKLKRKVIDHLLSDEEKQNLSVQSLNHLAYDLILLEKYNEAEELLEIALKKDQCNSYLYATKGMNCLRQSELRLGHELYLQSIKMSPDDANLRQKYHYEYGKALRLDGQFDEALQELNGALHSDATYVPLRDIEMEIRKAQEKNRAV